MKIVVLDGFTLNPGDLSWDALKELGDVEVHDRTESGEVVSRARDADAVFTNKVVLDRAVIEQLPRLKFIGVLATGYNVVDTEAARERGVLVTNVPAYATSSVAQHAFALLLELAERTGHHSAAVREGRWTASKDFCFWDYPLIGLDGLTMGIVGFGRIGRAVAALALAFGMRIIAHRRPSSPTDFAPVEFVDLEAVFFQSDCLCLCCPLTAETERLVNKQRLELMKRTAFLINVSRGPVVDEEALADALNAGKIAGAGLDVLSVEPPPADNPLLGAKNCIITPHIAWANNTSRARLMDIAVNNLKAFIAGNPQNVVN